MSIVIASSLVGFGIGCAIIHHNSPEVQERRRITEERINKNMVSIRKKYDKRKFITKFIDEIPELSYYEAAQLKNKLGDIYLEWNDE